MLILSIDHSTISKRNINYIKIFINNETIFTSETKALNNNNMGQKSTKKCFTIQFPRTNERKGKITRRQEVILLSKKNGETMTSIIKCLLSAK